MAHAIRPQPANLAFPSDRYRRHWHRVEIFDPAGRRLAKLYSEDGADLRQRSARWPRALGLELTQRYTPASG